MIDVIVFTASTALWALSEAWIGLRRRAPDRSRDAGTLSRLVLVIGGCVALAAAVSLWPPARAPDDWHPVLRWLGSAVMLTGMGFRWWSIRVLAEHFTVDVAIAADHRLIRSGPYRRLRHPSYTGLLLTVAGFLCALGSGLAPLVIAWPLWAALRQRIRIEEAALSEAFPVDYPAYARTTRRLVPGVW
ncbi:MULTISPECIES: methyltransferase family protein [Luteimonas]|uniref:methyltransferase family protein n=1 Tax=Luteimonas TaxID=83614 RepID=UPI000C79A522|nr:MULTISPECIES: isoprenylcysteine carboxylmethyltransferase family protein [Luteimonas]